MIADPALQKCPELVLFSILGKDARNLLHRASIITLHQLKSACGPGRAQGGGQRLQNFLLFSGRQLRKNRNEPRLLFFDQSGKREGKIRCLQSRTAREQFVAADDQLEGKRRIQPLVARRGIFDRGHDRLQLRLGFVEFVVELDDLVQRRHLLFRLTGLVEKGQQLVRARNFFSAQLNRFGLLRGQMKKAVFLESLRR